MKLWHFIVVGVVVVLASIVSIGYALLRPAPVIQPIQFSHKIHLESEPPEGQEKITCKTCHKYYDTRTVAGRPSISGCISCHATSSKKKKPEIEKILAYDKRGEEISWKRIYDIPDHVFFSHRRHTSSPQSATEKSISEDSAERPWKHEQEDKEGAKQIRQPIKCAVCHGPIEKAVTPPPTPLIDITMEFCISCHKQEQVTVDCMACHI